MPADEELSEDRQESTEEPNGEGSSETDEALGGDGASEADDATPSATKEEGIVVHATDGSGRVFRLSNDEAAAWINYGLSKARAESERKVEDVRDEPKDEAKIEDDLEDDPHVRELRTLREKTTKLEKHLAELDDDRKARVEQEESRQRQKRYENTIKRLAGTYAKGADDLTLELIEDRAKRILIQRREDGRHISDDDAYKAAAREIGQRMTEKYAGYLKDKKRVAETAPEGPGGAAVMSPPSNNKTMTKEEQRKLAGEMSSGAVKKRANRLFDEILSGAAAP